MKDYNKDFEKYDQLLKYHHIGIDTVWKEVEPRLNKRKKRRFILIPFFISLLLLLAYLSWDMGSRDLEKFSFNNFKKAVQKNDVNKTKISRLLSNTETIHASKIENRDGVQLSKSSDSSLSEKSTNLESKVSKSDKRMNIPPSLIIHDSGTVPSKNDLEQKPLHVSKHRKKHHKKLSKTDQYAILPPASISSPTRQLTIQDRAILNAQPIILLADLKKEKSNFQIGFSSGLVKLLDKRSTTFNDRDLHNEKGLIGTYSELFAEFDLSPHITVSTGLSHTLFQNSYTGRVINYINGATYDIAHIYINNVGLKQETYGELRKTTVQPVDVVWIRRQQRINYFIGLSYVERYSQITLRSGVQLNYNLYNRLSGYEYEDASIFRLDKNHLLKKSYRPLSSKVFLRASMSVSDYQLGIEPYLLVRPETNSNNLSRINSKYTPGINIVITRPLNI